MISHLKKLCINILVMILSPVLVLGSLELAVRAFGSHKIDTYYDGQTKAVLGNHVPKKQPDECRIFIFGGSSAYGFPVADRYSIAAWLRKSFPLLLPNKMIRVMNCAWPGKASHHDLEGVHSVLKYQPDLFIIYTGHNEATTVNRLFVDYWIYRLELHLQYRSALYKFLLKRIHRLMSFLKNGPHSHHVEKQYREEVIAQKLYHKKEVTDEEYARIVKEFDRNIESIIRLARQHHIEVVLLNLPSNIRDIPPVVSIHRDNLTGAQLAQWNQDFEKGQELERKNDCQNAITAYLATAVIDPAYADLQYHLAECYEKVGSYSEAKKAYTLARDYDARPWRAKSILNDTILKLAKKHHLIFVDIVGAMERLSPHGIISSGLVYDDVHPTIQAQQVITDEILHALAKENKIAPAAKWQWTSLESAKENKSKDDWKVDGTLNAYRYVLRGLNLWEEKRYSMAIDDLEKGLILMPKFLESYAFLADSYNRMGLSDKAVSAFRALQDKDLSLSNMLIAKYPDIQESFDSVMKLSAAKKIKP